MCFIDSQRCCGFSFDIGKTVSVDLGGRCVGAGITETNHRVGIPDDGCQ